MIVRPVWNIKLNNLTRIEIFYIFVAEEYGDKVVVGKLDVDSNPGVSYKYGIRNIPTILFFKDGEVADKQVGVVPKGVISQKIDALL